jgi:hypothetical protein
MAKMVLTGIMAGLLLCTAAPLKAEETEKPLTNLDVANMVKAGLPESTIILTIQMASQREATNFDTSPGALIELKRQGATEKILNTVLWAQPLGAAPEPRSSEIDAAPGLPTQPGVYYRSSSGWAALPSFLLWPPLMAPWSAAVGFARKDYSIALPGLHAQLQIAEPRPVFYLREPQSGAAGQLLQLATKKKDHRELWLSPGDVFTTQIGYRPSALQDVEFEELVPNVFTVRTKFALGTGEYLFCTPVPGGHRLLLCYEFGINLETPPPLG